MVDHRPCPSRLSCTVSSFRPDLRSLNGLRVSQHAAPVRGRTSSFDGAFEDAKTPYHRSYRSLTVVLDVFLLPRIERAWISYQWLGELVLVTHTYSYRIREYYVFCYKLRGQRNSTVTEERPPGDEPIRVVPGEGVRTIPGFEQAHGSNRAGESGWNELLVQGGGQSSVSGCHQ